MTSPGDETAAQRLRRLAEAKRLAGLGAEVILPACACVNSIVHKQKITRWIAPWSCLADLSKRVGVSASRRLMYAGPSSGELRAYLKTDGLRALGGLTAPDDGRVR